MCDMITLMTEWIWSIIRDRDGDTSRVIRSRGGVLGGRILMMGARDARAHSNTRVHQAIDSWTRLHIWIRSFTLR